MRGGQMDEKTLKEIYEFLEWDLLEKLEYPCESCGFFECEKNSLNAQGIIKKKYRWNDIDHGQCLKRAKTRLKELHDLLRAPEFSKYSNETCSLCGASKYKHDMALHIEFEQREKRIESVRLCRRCNAKYLRRKKAIHMGYRKM
jgi:hypothetical protein